MCVGLVFNGFSFISGGYRRNQWLVVYRTGGIDRLGRFQNLDRHRMSAPALSPAPSMGRSSRKSCVLAGAARDTQASACKRLWTARSLMRLQSQAM